MVPLVSGISPAIAESRVDFLLPTGPVMTVKVPDSAVNVISCRIHSFSRSSCFFVSYITRKVVGFLVLPPYEERKHLDFLRVDLPGYFSLKLESFRRSCFLH